MATSELTRRELLALSAVGLVAGAPGSARAAGPRGQLTWGIHVSLAPTWFDPAETPGLITPFMILYALHDAMVKPMPGQPLAPCLAESFSAAEDGRSYDFVLRQGAIFHNGEPITADDVKFSFERYRGASHSLVQDRVANIETPDPRHVRFNLKAPWPDFLTFTQRPPEPAGSCPRSMSRRSATTCSKRRRLALGPTNSCRSRPASNWCSKRSTSIGARRRV